MAAIEHATYNDEMPVEIAPLPQNSGGKALKDITYGSIAGMVGKFIEYPFDTIKVRLQSQPHGVPLLYKGPIDCFRQSIQADGFRGLYRGISAPLAGAAVENSSLFFSYRVAKDLLQLSTIYSAEEPLPFSGLLISGAASGAFTSVLLTPIELVKCKMQVPSTSGIRPSPLNIIATVFRHDGVFGFWRGQMGTLIRETGGSAAWFGSYEGVSAIFRRSKRRHLSPDDEEYASAEHSPLPLWQQMLAGAAAGVGYNFIFYPADTIKSRMQTEDITLSIPGEKRSFWNVGKSVWQQQGLRGLYRGCGITVARSAPSSAFIFSVYEGLCRYF